MTAEIVTDVVDDSFGSEVLERSNELPVVVDFWAPWCGPCRIIGPVLEQLAGEFAGRVRLVKVNIDENPKVATQYGISSIPAVMAFRDGAPATQFVGAVPEPQARAFFQSLLPNEADLAAAAGVEARDGGDRESAESHFESALEHDPKHPAATVGLAQLALDGGDVERARTLAGRFASNPEAARILALAAFAGGEGGDGDDRAALEQRISDDMRDAEAHYALGKLLASVSEWEAALDHLLMTVRLDRKLDGDGGRLRMLDVFKALGDDDALTQDYRQRLTSVIF
ncbi:MAG: thioredoxin [Dehalococcoidia bacterium]|nr:thioredoxin [Dehalococcoidia bacterium]